MQLISVLVACAAAVSAVEIKKTAASADQVAFLQKYSSEEGAVVMPSGMMYKEIKAGAGGSPGPGTSCSCHYEGRTAASYPSGPTFDSSYERGKPASFAPSQVIKAWTEAMQMMKVGSKWEIVCPPEVAYGSRAMGAKIPANSVLVFTMEMLACPGIASSDL
ncbi:hypothetical protein M885DRAFT_512897 [Pelagophyceae sp. CCMP2097]|nr:hypothetical protein M885DRAFT_512897 [Pelagophyceae sp. CCMP2097]